MKKILDTLCFSLQTPCIRSHESHHKLQKTIVEHVKTHLENKNNFIHNDFTEQNKHCNTALVFINRKRLQY